MTHCPTYTDPTAVNVVSVDNSNVYVIPSTAGTGHTRGIIVWLHGGPQGPIPIPPALASTQITWANTQAADGWHSMQVAYPEDFVAMTGMKTVWGDVTADTGHGSRFVATTLAWWDHVVSYIYRRFGTIPIMLMGGSWGGWHTLQIMKNKPTGIAGFICSIAAVKFSGITNNVGEYPSGSGLSWSTLNSTGADNASSCLNAITVPGIIQVMLGNGTTDAIVNVPDQIAVKDAAIGAGRAITYIPKTAGTHLDASPFTSAAGSYAADPLNYSYWMLHTLDPLCPQAF